MVSVAFICRPFSLLVSPIGVSIYFPRFAAEKMSDWNGERAPVVLQPPTENGDWQQRDGRSFEVTGSDARKRFKEFFRNYQINSVYIYRDLLILRYGRREWFVEVDLAHLNEYDEILFNNVQTKPDEMIPLFEKGAHSGAIVS